MTQQTKKRKAYTAEEKVSIVKEHLIGKKPVWTFRTSIQAVRFIICARYWMAAVVPLCIGCWAKR